MRTLIRMGVDSSREGSTEPRMIGPRGSNHPILLDPGSCSGGSNHTATPAIKGSSMYLATVQTIVVD